MSRRGAYGKPWRPPADGWAVPPRAYLGGLYQHRHNSLNGLTRYLNTTQVALQQNLVGAPATRPAITVGEPCGGPAGSGPVTGPWIGVGDDQLATPPANTYAATGTVDLGANCRLPGGKWVQAVRQWHGAYGWLSHDPAGQVDTNCYTAIADENGVAPGGTGYINTYANLQYESAQTTPDQTKYLTLSVSATYSFTELNAYTGTYVTQHVITASGGGSVSVGANSGLLTGAMSTSEDEYINTGGGLNHSKHLVNGVGWTNDGTTTSTTPIPNNGGTVVDADLAATPYGLTDVPGVTAALALYNDMIDQWTAAINLAGGTVPPKVYPAYTPGGWSVNTSFVAPVPSGLGGPQTNTLMITVSRTNTVYSWTVSYSIYLTLEGTPRYQLSYSGALTLSGVNASASVYADVVSLLGEWNLADDAQYPPRTDGVWQIAPLMSRDELPSNQSPLQGFVPYYVNDLRAPITDANGNGPWTTPVNPPPPGWTYAPNNNDGSGLPPSDPGYDGAVGWQPTYSLMAWFDVNGWGFTFPYGYNSGNATATGLVQFALTGAVLGAPKAAGYQDFFDFRAQVWRCCEFETEAGETDINWYLAGYGEWLHDVISATGAQLPLNCTQWTSRLDAFSKPPYAYLIQGDPGIYATPPDTRAHRADALWAQKCCEYAELWPSYNFFRPAGADRFLIDEGTAVCVSGLSGNTFTSVDYQGNPVTLGVATGDAWGGASVGGWFAISVSGSTVTLGTKLWDVPSGWAAPSGDTATVFGRLRFPSAPAILGRDAVNGVTNNGDGTVTLTLAAAEPWLLTGDKLDLFSATVSYDSRGNRTGETMAALATNLTATVVSATQVKVTATYSAVAGTQYIMSHGAPDWSWDDNGRKGDWVYLDWTLDNRTNGEAARLAAGVVDCSGTPVTLAGNNGYAGFTQTQYEGSTGLPFKPCCVMAIAITPNGETWVNGTAHGFPTTFAFDGRYGARWAAEIEEARTDLLWQTPHNPCGNALGWTMDNGTCQADNDATAFYGYPPLVEARVTVPTNGGAGQNLTAPTPPGGLGYLSPVSNVGGMGAPGQIGFDASTGLPSPAWTFWGYRQAIEAGCGGGCRFDYVGWENLPCVSSYAAPLGSAAPAGTATGTTGTGGTT